MEPVINSVKLNDGDITYFVTKTKVHRLVVLEIQKGKVNIKKNTIPQLNCVHILFEDAIFDLLKKATLVSDLFTDEDSARKILQSEKEAFILGSAAIKLIYESPNCIIFSDSPHHADGAFDVYYLPRF